MAFDIVEVNEGHGRDAFCCGRNDLIDDFCRSKALDHNQRHLTRVKVAVSPDGRVVGFYSMAATTLRVDKLAMMLGGPEKECPAFHLQMLAICQNEERGILGPALIDDAFRSASRAQHDIGARCLYLEAANDALVPYYESFGFTVLNRKTGAMFAPIDLVVDAVTAA